MHVVDTTMYWARHGGGVRRYLEAKSRWLHRHRADGWRHTVVTPGPWRCTSPQVRGLPLPGAQGYRFAAGRRDARAVLQALAPDLLEAGDPWQLAWAALDAGQALGVPVVGFHHGDFVQRARDRGGAPAARLAQTYARHLYRHFDLVVTPSRYAAQRLAVCGGVRPEHLIVQPLGVDLTTFSRTRRDCRWRWRLGLQPHQHLLVFAGRYAPEKNLPVLFEAVQRLGRNVVLLLLGSGPVRLPPPRSGTIIDGGYLQQRARLASLLASADLFVHAGTQETFGLAALEALACGLPAVVPAAGGLGELIDASVGATVWPADAAHFAAAIAATLARPRAALRHAARQRAEDHDWNTVFARLTTRYRALTDARQDPG